MASSNQPLSQDGEIGEGSGELKRSRSLITVRDAKRARAEISRLPRLTREDLLHRGVMQEKSCLLTDSASPIPRYQLRFQNCLPTCVYTCHEIMAEDNDRLQISLVDTATGDGVASGPLSSENIMVLVLDGHFCGTKRKSKEEFENHIVRPRDGKGPLLKGNLEIQLIDGVGYLQDISFTDNSSWRPSKKFRLAVCCVTEGIQEGISNPFRVKEHRSYLNEKHHPPKLTDPVWNLVNIRKEGVYHQRLTDARILDVQLFLQALSINPENLRRLLQNGSSRRIPDKTWEAIITNAQECFPGDQLYSYDVVEQNITLIFNSVYLLLGAKSNGQYHAIKNLNPTTKASLEKLQRQAFEHPTSIKLDGMCIQEFNDLVTESISLSVPFPQCSVEASRQVKLFESSAPPYSQLGHTNQEHTSEQSIHPLTIPPTHAAIPGQNSEELRSSCFSDYVPTEVNRNMPDTSYVQDVPDTSYVQDVPQLRDSMFIQPEISNSLVDWRLLIPPSDDQVDLGQFPQESFVPPHEAPGFSNMGNEHAYAWCSSFRGSFGSLSDYFTNDECIWELKQSDPMVLDVVRSSSKWVKLLAVLKWGLFAYLSTRKLGNTSDHPRELV